MSVPSRLFGLAMVVLLGLPAGGLAAGRVADDMVVLDASGKVIGPIVNVTAPTSATVLIEDGGDTFLVSMVRNRFLSGTATVYFTDAACQSAPLLRFPPNAADDLSPRAGVGPGSALLVASGAPAPILSLNAVWNNFVDPPACQAIVEDSAVMVGTTPRLILEQRFPPPYRLGLLQGGREARRVPGMVDGSGGLVGRVVGTDTDPTIAEVQTAAGAGAVLARLQRTKVLGGTGVRAVYLAGNCQGPAHIEIGPPDFVPGGQPLGRFTAVGQGGVFLVQDGPPANVDYASLWDAVADGCANVGQSVSAVPAQPLAGFAFQPPFALALERPASEAGRRPRATAVAVDSEGRRVGPAVTFGVFDEAAVGVEIDGQVGLVVAAGARLLGLGTALFASGDCTGDAFMAVVDVPGIPLLFTPTVMDGQGQVRVPAGPPAPTLLASVLTSAVPAECDTIDPPENLGVVPTTPAADLSAVVPPLVLR